MNKKIFLVLFLVFCCITFCGCKKNKSVILFNRYPISQKNLLDNSNVFKTDERIYFVYLTKKDLKTEDIRIKIFKRNTDAHDAYGSLVYSNTFHLKKGEVNYFTDYIVMHKPGYYIMHVYKMDYLWKPDAIGDFRVDER